MQILILWVLFLLHLRHRRLCENKSAVSTTSLFNAKIHLSNVYYTTGRTHEFYRSAMYTSDTHTTTLYYNRILFWFHVMCMGASNTLKVIGMLQSWYEDFFTPRRGFEVWNIGSSPFENHGHCMAIRNKYKTKIYIQMIRCFLPFATITNENFVLIYEKRFFFL